ncbi:hypothetical protein I79_002423 [Cricetulus griseus]|uniref:Uncharacterized protein n=1 Tax=Cricetulus griseus TaxID=10029 RepID=G3GXD3_CRIGR|nr:hypothetical protein I79_002423 [Cricetulus griseus]
MDTAVGRTGCAVKLRYGGGLGTVNTILIYDDSNLGWAYGSPASLEELMCVKGRKQDGMTGLCSPEGKHAPEPCMVVQASNLSAQEDGWFKTSLDYTDLVSTQERQTLGDQTDGSITAVLTMQT